MKSNGSKLSKLIACLAFSSAAFGSVNQSSALIIQQEINENLQRQMVRHATRTTILERFYNKLRKNPTKRVSTAINEATDETPYFEIFHALTAKPWGNYVPRDLLVLAEQIKKGEKPELEDLIELEKDLLFNSIPERI